MVVAIIAMLVSFLMPALGRAKMLTRAAMCGTNLKGIGSSVVLYAEDWNYYPGARYGPGAVAFGFDQVRMTLPGLLCPQYIGTAKMFFCPAESRTLGDRPHPFFEGPGGSYGAMSYEAYVVGSADWAENKGNRRLAWGTLGTTYAVPMSILIWKYGLFDNKQLTQHNYWSHDGLVDRASAEGNPKSLYMVDKQSGIHLYDPEDISDRHEVVNYLTFNGGVIRTTREKLIAACDAAEDPWVFEYRVSPSP